MSSGDAMSAHSAKCARCSSSERPGFPTWSASASFQCPRDCAGAIASFESTFATTDDHVAWMSPPVRHRSARTSPRATQRAQPGASPSLALFVGPQLETAIVIERFVAREHSSNAARKSAQLAFCGVRDAPPHTSILT